MKHTDFTDAIADAMRPHGEGDVDVLALRAGTMVRVRAARRRRAALVAAGAAAAVAVSLAAVPQLFDDSARGPEPGAPPSVSAPPNRPAMQVMTLPPADVPGAAQRPDTVGNDPAVLHFAADLTALDAHGGWWRTGGGFERAEFYAGPAGADGKYRHAATVMISQTLDGALTAGPGAHDTPGADNPPTPVPATVHGRPAQLRKFTEYWSTGIPVWVLSWQPADGFWAVLTMETNDEAAVLRGASGLRFDRSQRCAVPIRLNAPPTGTVWAKCSTGLSPAAANARSWYTSMLSFRNAAGGTLGLDYGTLADFAAEGDAFVPNRTVNGRPAMWSTGEQGPQGQLAVPGSGGRNLLISIRGDGFTEQDALALAGAAVFSDDLVDLSTWPVRAVG
jgi:hypothetical protein